MTRGSFEACGQRPNPLHEAASDRSFSAVIGADRRTKFKRAIGAAEPTDANFRRVPKADDRTADADPPIPPTFDLAYFLADFGSDDEVGAAVSFSTRA
jgi:hypothetical protein